MIFLAQFMRHIILLPEHWHRAGVTVAALVILHQTFPTGRLHQVEECSRERISKILVVVAHPLYSEIEATLEAPVG